jgi:hypothetical protein
LIGVFLSAEIFIVGAGRLVRESQQHLARADAFSSQLEIKSKILINCRQL